VHLDGAEKGDLSKIGSIKASVTSKTKSMWKKVKGQEGCCVQEGCF